MTARIGQVAGAAQADVTSVLLEGLAVQISLPQSLQYDQVKVAVETVDGSTIYSPDDQSQPSTLLSTRNNSEKRWFVLDHGKPTQVAQVQLWARPVEWVHFTNIHLQPNHPTGVKT